MNLNTNLWTETHNMKRGVAASSWLNSVTDTAVCRQLVSQSVVVAATSLEMVYSEPLKGLFRLISKLQQEDAFVAQKIAEIDSLRDQPTDEMKA